MNLKKIFLVIAGLGILLNSSAQTSKRYTVAKPGTLVEMLTEEEAAVFKRGRNANPHSHPRGATRREYQVATGLEALFGWLYLRGETGRLNELFEMMMEGED